MTKRLKKLADIIPIVSKKGSDLASVCFEACLLQGSLDKSDLNNKIVGLTGDGVFAKGNAPFKSKIQELIDKTLVFRWDLLHMINRCHIDAKKGEVVIDSLEDADEVGLDDDHIDNDSGTKDEVVGSLISELINYIQKEAKAFRHGLAYAQLKKVTSGVFKRPKVWSSTRMVVYEFEMLERFLENSLFLDIPIKFLLLAKFHCLTMFALKIILKNVQRIDVTPEYVQKVIVGEVGRNSMELACKVAIDVYSNKDTSYMYR